MYKEKWICSFITVFLSSPMAFGEEPGGHHGHCDATAALKPILSVGDFDGNGVVDGIDIAMLAKQIGKHEYVALFDRNADEKLNVRDVVILAHEVGSYSTLLDQQLVQLFQATEKYRNQQIAILDGYRPFTQQLAGHGGHYAKLPFMLTADGSLDPNYENILDENFEVTKPEGLNYDDQGQLAAVFFYHGINIFSWALGTAEERQQLAQQALYMSLPQTRMQSIPEGFATDSDMWHSHYGACFSRLNYPTMQLDPSLVPIFNQHTTAQQCGQFSALDQNSSEPVFGWIPAFNMLHVWLYKLNPCGVFGGTHPHIASDYPAEPHYQSFEDWLLGMGISP